MALDRPSTEHTAPEVAAGDFRRAVETVHEGTSDSLWSNAGRGESEDLTFDELQRLADEEESKHAEGKSSEAKPDRRSQPSDTGPVPGGNEADDSDDITFEELQALADEEEAKYLALKADKDRTATSDDSRSRGADLDTSSSGPSPDTPLSAQASDHSDATPGVQAADQSVSHQSGPADIFPAFPLAGTSGDTAVPGREDQIPSQLAHTTSDETTSSTIDSDQRPEPESGSTDSTDVILEVADEGPESLPPDESLESPDITESHESGHATDPPDLAHAQDLDTEDDLREAADRPEPAAGPENPERLVEGAPGREDNPDDGSPSSGAVEEPADGLIQPTNEPESRPPAEVPSREDIGEDILSVDAARDRSDPPTTTALFDSEQANGNRTVSLVDTELHEPYGHIDGPRDLEGDAPLRLSTTESGHKDLLNKPPPDSTVVVDERFTYRTDHLGRVVHASAKLEIVDLDHPRDKSAQAQLIGKLPGDHAGHIFARIFQGPSDSINLTPMEGRRVNLGAYKTSENVWRRALDQGRDVQVEIELVFRKDSMRPDAFAVTYWIDGKVTYDDIPNLPAKDDHDNT